MKKLLTAFLVLCLIGRAADQSPLFPLADKDVNGLTSTSQPSSKRALDVTSYQLTSPWVDNISQFGGSNVVTGTGASGAGIPRVTVSNDSNVLVTQSTNPWVVVPNTADKVTFTYGTTQFIPAGGVFQDTSPTLTAGQAGIVRMTNQRAWHCNLRNSSGAEVGSAPASPVYTTSSITGTGGGSDVSSLVSANKLYSVAIELVMGSASADTPIFTIKNPTGSGKTIFIKSITYGTDASTQIKAKMFGSPTVTANGTAVTPVNRNIGITSIATALVFSGPTVSANGAQLAVDFYAANANSEKLVNEDFSVGLTENKTLLFTGQAGSNNKNILVTIIWVEI